MDGTVLVADDDRTIRTVLTQAFTRAGCRVHATSSLTTLMRWIAEGRGDLVISDVMMPDGNGLEMLPKIHQDRPALPVIVISAQNTIMTAIKANEVSAFDYLPKPFDLPQLLQCAARALKERKPTKTAAQIAEPKPDEALPLIGKTPVMQDLYRNVARVMHSEMPIMVVGETGTGKSMLGRILHDFSDRHASGLGILNDALLRDGEHADKLCARVRGGTLIIDGMDDFSSEHQLRLLSLISALIAQGTRIISILKSQSEEEAATRLRDDLYFRLSGVALYCPALRERTEDVPLLVDHFLRRANREGALSLQISPEAVALMQYYNWPGNVRQLENFVKRLVVLARDQKIDRDWVELELRSQPGASDALPRRAGAKLAADVEKHVRRYFELHGDMLPPAGVYARVLREFEAPLIEVALEATDGNQARCAELLGLNRNTLRKKIRELDIEVARRRKLS